MTSESGEKNLQKELLDLQVEVVKLRKQFEFYNSFRRNFSVAILRGFASAIGATVVFGLALALLIQVIRSIDYVPILNNILNSGAIEEIVQKFTQTASP